LRGLEQSVGTLRRQDYLNVVSNDNHKYCYLKVILEYLTETVIPPIKSGGALPLKMGEITLALK